MATTWSYTAHAAPYNYLGISNGNHCSHRFTMSKLSLTSTYVCSIKIKVTSYSSTRSDAIMSTTNTSYPIRVLISTNTTNPSMGSSTYDGTLTYSSDGYLSATFTKTLQANTTYYLYLFAGWSASTDAGYKFVTYYGDASATITADTGLVHIGNGSGWDDYLIYIGNGSGWDLCIPYVGNGSGWDICS